MILISARKLNSFIAICCVFLLLPLSSGAQQAVSLSVSPTIFEMTATPQQEWESSLRIININPFELTVYAEVVNFKPMNERGVPEFIPVEPDTEVTTFAEWITVTDQPIVLPAEKTVEIPITIAVPEQAPPGGHYAAVLIGTRPPEDAENASKVETSQIVSTLLFLRVGGDIQEEGNIRSFRTTHSILNRPEATFELRFENRGNVYVQPRGEIVIKNMWGQERGKIPVNRRNMFGYVPQDSIRNYTFEWSGEWSPADIGRYTAEVTLAYGEQVQKFTYAQTAFWIIPWKPLLGVLLFIALFIWFVSWVIKLYVRHMLRLAGLDTTSSGKPKVVRSAVTKKVSVVAPIEAGILDLRARFERSGTEGRTNKLQVIVQFVNTYKMFFLALVVAILAFSMIVWFVRSVFVAERSYQVTIQDQNGDVTLNSEEIKYEETTNAPAPTPTAIDSSAPPIKVINRSGTNGAAAKTAERLEAAGFSITELGTDLGVSEEITVVIYSPALVNTAVEISEALDGALLSAYESEATEEIVVYVGTDHEF